MFEKLNAYKNKHGDCLVPQRYNKDRALGRWVPTQREMNRLNTLKAERKEKLDSIGFVWEPDDQKWNEMFEKLKAYKHKRGDCLVPKRYNKDRALGRWVMMQRTERKADILAAEREQKLDSIGFVWEVRPDPDDQWNIMFDKLKAYKQKHGDCLVPHQYKKDKFLGLWVSRQRRGRKANRLVAERKAKLDSIGFVWEVNPQWNKMFDKLKAYKRNYGDCLVPRPYDKDRSLGQWVASQRNQKKANKLAAEREEKLDSIGFVWEVNPDPDDQWNKMFEKLKAYKHNYGDCLVPNRYNKDKAFGLWVSRQRTMNRINTLKAERKAKLDSIGFVWKVGSEYKPEPDDQWNLMYEKMIAFRQKHGHCLVLSRQDRQLTSWLIRQRTMRRESKLPSDRIAKLDSIDGFVWALRPTDERWYFMFEKLKVYKREHGDCLVPTAYVNDKQLGIWVTNQRSLNKTNRLSAERKRQLESIGFVWDVREYVHQQK
jgi:hypothetical protein